MFHLYDLYDLSIYTFFVYIDMYCIYAEKFLEKYIHINKPKFSPIRILCVLHLQFSSKQKILYSHNTNNVCFVIAYIPIYRIAIYGNRYLMYISSLFTITQTSLFSVVQPFTYTYSYTSLFFI